jgi:pyruvate/2-oxoglutarate dehydrogenase complex dihydrolipoamide acyltransferase (E2) component
MFQLTDSGEAIAPDIWQEDIATSAPRYWVRQPQSTKPVLMLMPTKEEAKPAAPTRAATQKTQQPLEVNLNSLDSAALRQLCSKHGIQWRDARGKGKHLTKAAMVFQLEQKATA